MCIPFKRSSRIRRFPWRRRSSTMLEQAMAMRKREEEVVFPNAAGIDVGASSHWVAVPRHQAGEPVREFGAMTDDLNALADWLLACGGRHGGAGVRRRVLDPDLRGARAAWLEGLAGRCPADEVRARPQERRARLPVAAEADEPGTAARGLAPRRRGLRRTSGGTPEGRAARRAKYLGAAPAEGDGADEHPAYRGAQRRHGCRRPGHHPRHRGRRARPSRAGPAPQPASEGQRRTCAAH